MAEIASFVGNWVLISALYAVIAIGFTLIFGVGNNLNLFHGASLTIGAYAAHVVFSLGYPMPVIILAGVLVPGLVNVVLFSTIIKRRMDSPITIMIITLILAIIVEELIRILFGSGSRVVPSLVSGNFDVFGVRLQVTRVLVFFISWLIIFGLIYVLNYTTIGKAIRATSMDRKGAAIAGVQINRMLIYVWTLAGMLAGLAGIFLAMFETATFNMGLDPLILSFTIVVVGGLGSVKGSIVGAYLIGGLETFTTSFIAPQLRGFTSLIVLIVILLVLPTGLFGREELEEEG